MPWQFSSGLGGGELVRRPGQVKGNECLKTRIAIGSGQKEEFSGEY